MTDGQINAVYGLTGKAAGVVKSARRMDFFFMAIFTVTVFMFACLIIHEQLILGKPWDFEFVFIWAAVSLAMAIMYLWSSLGDNYTVKVTLGPQECEIVEVRGKKVIAYVEVKTLERWRDFTSQRLYYSFILLGGEGGAELGLIQQSIDNFDRLYADLSARCQAAGAKVLPPNDSSGPGWRALDVKSRRLLRLGSFGAFALFAAITFFSALEIKDAYDLRYNGQTVMAEITRHEPKARPCISYKFKANDGREYKGRLGGMIFNRGMCLEFSKRDEVPVKYRLADPTQKVGPGESDDFFLNILLTALFAAFMGISFLGAFWPHSGREVLIRWRLYKRLA